MTIRELEAEAIIALWLAIHGGDPGPGEVSKETTARAAWQLVGSLANYAEGVIAEQDVSKERALATEMITNLKRVGCKVSLRKQGEQEEVTPDNVETFLRADALEHPLSRCYCFSWKGISHCYCFTPPRFRTHA
jgi:hypothetical protein